MSIPFPDIGTGLFLFLSTHLPNPIPVSVPDEVGCVFWYLENSAFVLKQKLPTIPSGKAAQRLDKLLGGGEGEHLSFLEGSKVPGNQTVSQ